MEKGRGYTYLVFTWTESCKFFRPPTGGIGSPLSRILFGCRTGVPPVQAPYHRGGACATLKGQTP